MKLKYNILLIAIILSANSAYAQYAEDALRFSETEQGATARLRALGNAQTALGGDISSLSGNPAGLGFFTRSDISLTTDFTNSKVNGSYLGASTTAQKDKLGLTYLGAVWHTSVRKPKGADLTSGWLGFNFGLSYNKTNNFNSTIEYGGVNPRSSIADFFADNANSTEFYEGNLTDMAYKNYLIEYDAAIANSDYFPTTNNNTTQRNISYRTGSQSEVNLGFGANYSNKFYIGASIGLTSINYNADRRFTEGGITLRESDFPQGTTLSEGVKNYLDASYSASYNTAQTTEGGGVNARLGFIYKPVNYLRIGLNFTTPTWYSVDDSYAEVLNARFQPKGNSPAVPAGNLEDDIFDYNYNLRTPYTVSGGLAFVFENGLITGNAEYIDYTAIHFSSDEASTTRNVNSDIKENYQEAVNLRAGAEYRINNIYLRAGYNKTGNPYKNNSFLKETFSGGLGYRINNFYIDATYSYTDLKLSERPYNISTSYIYYGDTGAGETATIKNQMGRVFLTVGTRF